MSQYEYGYNYEGIIGKYSSMNKVKHHVTRDNRFGKYKQNMAESSGADRDKEEKNSQYNKYVEEITPKNNCLMNCIKAFVTGGAICVLGQVFTEIFMALGNTKENAALYTTICLILTSIVLTGFNIYPLITNFGGAGSLVPITGFANSVVAPAIEYKKEGQVFGIGCKIFTIAGPVILYGLLSSFLLGFIYWIIRTVPS